MLRQKLLCQGAMAWTVGEESQVQGEINQVDLGLKGVCGMEQDKMESYTPRPTTGHLKKGLIVTQKLRDVFCHTSPELLE